MDANPRRETAPPPEDDAVTSQDDQLVEAFDDQDDPHLEAWLAAREFELDEMAWAIADHYRDEVDR